MADVLNLPCLPYERSTEHLSTKFGFIHFEMVEHDTNSLRRSKSWSGELSSTPDEEPGKQPPTSAQAENSDGLACPLCGKDHAKGGARPVRERRIYLKKCLKAALLLPEGSEERAAALQRFLKDGKAFACKALTILGLTEGLASVAAADVSPPRTPGAFMHSIP
eukprot:TRINITY_DN92096_c0_g1_i1.p1 TRINITY_DN92096_c0_g1~~TRINITY_DN92096_c0_g1_i1.p1  ORF type:complete len:181 (+),score=40.70 TRINITY_DN92096_c0_g1_i1:54-545(+)